MRAPGYETLDAVGTGRPVEYASGGGMRRPVDIGRYGQRGPDAATRQMHADWRDELAAMKARLAELEAH